MNRYINYHNHKDYSNLMTTDSTAKYEDYAKKIVELGYGCLTSVEHGWQGQYLECYEVAKKYNIPFRYGVEAYWVIDNKEKDRTNNHIIIMAKSMKGIKSINLSLSMANIDGFYYRPRLSLEQILDFPSDDVFITSACLAFGGYGEEKTEEIIIKLRNKFKDNFMLEIQNHCTEKQVKWNTFIKEMSRKHSIKLIAGIDSHYIDEKSAEDRDMFLKAKGINYEDEQGWFLDFPSYDEAKYRFLKQGVFNEVEIEEALANTLAIENFEDVEFSYDFKIPNIFPEKSYDERVKHFKKIISENWKVEKNKIPKEKHEIYISEIKKEINIVTETKMVDYFILNYYVIKKAKEMGGELTFTGRGCFTKDAIIQTDNSLKTIDKIKVGDMVLNKDGIFRPVLNTFEYDIQEELIEFTYQKQGSSYKKYKNQCTLDHKVLTKDGWKQAKDLIVGDLLCVPKIKEQSECILYDLSKYTDYEYDENYVYEKHQTGMEYKYSPKWLDRNGIMNHNLAKKIVDGHRNFKPSGLASVKKLFENSPFKTLDDYSKYCKKHGMTTKKIKRFVEMDRLMNLFVGSMYADGWTQHTSALGFAVNNTSKNGVNRHMFHSVADRFGLSVYENKSKNKNLNQLFIMSSVLNKWFEVEFFKSKKGVDKILNSQLLKQNKDKIYWLKKGFDICDGSKNIKQNKLSYDSTSISLIGSYKIMNNILRKEPLSLDVRFGRIDSRGYNNKESYKVRRPIVRKKRCIDEDDNYWYLPIESISNIKDYKGKVYDLHIKDEHNYVINNIIVHNSAPSFYINKLLNFTTIDRISSPIQLFPERFMSISRILETKSLPDIDMNCSNPEVFIQAQKELLGEYSTYYMIALGKFKKKSAFKMYAKANNVDFEVANAISKNIDEYEKAKKYADEFEEIDILDFIDKENVELYKKSEKYNGIIDSASRHPCAVVTYGGNVLSDIGVIRLRDDIVTVMDGRYLDKYKYLKNDFLKVNVVSVIYDVFKEANIDPIPSDELLDIVENDEKTWKMFEDGVVMGLNQVEQDSTRGKCMKYKPSSIAEHSNFVASVRPSFQSMYKKFESREYFEYGIKEFDNLIQNEHLPSSFILMQEQIMATLMYAGFPSDETYGILKNIAKKKEGVIEPLKERFVEGFMKKIMESDLND